MSLAIVYSRTSSSMTALLVTVEAHIANGMPQFHIAGLPEAAVRESKHRVRSALINTGFEFPARRITINLAPADIPKEGGRFDLPIALGILAASGQLPKNKLASYEFAGELALSGELRPIQGVLPIVLGAREAKRSVFVPYANADEAGLVKEIEIFAVKHLLEVCSHLTGKKNLSVHLTENKPTRQESSLDLADLRGQLFARRALEIAAAGKHSLLLIGPPGTGKTMLASRLPSILPSLSDNQALEVAAVASLSHMGFEQENWGQLPFRAPHHTSSSIALVGGGRPPKPGEISLAHQGVLFLDELPEFDRHVLESLREPLESGVVTISRASCQMTFPAQFQLIAAMNPCPCGYSGSIHHPCRCTEEQIRRYRAKLSGPLLDRIDMHVEVQEIPSIRLIERESPGEKSDTVRIRVLNARQQQHDRQKKCNSEITAGEMEKYCALTDDTLQLLEGIMEKFHFSARVYHRIIKVARTLADLQACPAILESHITEAVSYRCLDRIKL